MLVYQRVKDMNGTYNQQYSGIFSIVLKMMISWEKGWSNVDLPGLVNVYTAIEHGHRNSGFTY